jgi:hypothetical protein
MPRIDSPHQSEKPSPSQSAAQALPKRGPTRNGENAAIGKGSSLVRTKLAEWLMIAIVVLYAAGLLVAPLIAIFLGALSEGLAAVTR